MLYYAARRYVEQLGRAAEYTTLKPLVLLVFTDFELFPRGGWKDRFELRGLGSGTLFSKHLAVVLVELPKFHKSVAEVTELSEKWAIFLKEGTRMQAQVLNEAWVTPELKKALAELELLEGDEKMRELYEARLDHVRVRMTELHGSFLEGHDKGLREGIEKGIERGLHTARQSILKILARRWPELWLEAEPLVSAMAELPALERLFDALLDAPDLASAREALLRQGRR